MTNMNKMFIIFEKLNHKYEKKQQHKGNKWSAVVTIIMLDVKIKQKLYMYVM